MLCSPYHDIRQRLFWVTTLFFLCFSLVVLGKSEIRAEEAFSTPSGSLWTTDAPRPGVIDTLLDFDIAYRGIYDGRLVLELAPGDRNLLESLGIEVTPLPFNPALPKIARDEEDYHDYEQTLDMLAQLSQQYPDLCKLVTLGYSVENRHIDALKISDHPDIDEDEPELRLAGAHHGDEFMSIEIPLLAAEMLLTEYETDARIRALVDETEIWVVPLVNPDGREASTRRNANAVDLNRNYGFVWHSGTGYGDDPFSEPEVQAMARHHLQRRFSISHSFHTYGEIVNYLWNYTDEDSPDEALLLEISRLYAEGTTAGGSEDIYEVTNGYDWYQTFGDLNDFSYGSSGGMDWTIELTPQSWTFPIERSWSRNRESILSTLEWSLKGLRGVVTDADTGDALQARIRILEHDWPVFSDSVAGDYHRLLLPGTYTLEVWASGYEAMRFQGLTVGTGDALRQDVALEANEEYYALRSVAVGMATDNPTPPHVASGPPDERSFSLGKNRWVVLDLGEILNDHEGEELEILEGPPYDGERYKVEISTSFAGPWQELGEGSGVCAFDFNISGVSQGRYVRIRDLGDTPDTTSPGFDLDTVRYFPYYVAPVDGDEDRDEEIDQDLTEIERSEPEAQETEESELTDSGDCDPYEAEAERSEPTENPGEDGDEDTQEEPDEIEESLPGTHGGCTKIPCGFSGFLWYIGAILSVWRRRRRFSTTFSRRTDVLCPISISTPSPINTMIGTTTK